MKYVCLVLAILLTLSLAQAAEKKSAAKAPAKKGAPKASSLTESDRTEIAEVARSYVTAFEKGDFALVKDTVSPEFMELVGGEAALKDRLTKVSEKTAKTKSPVIEQILEENGKTYVHVSPDGKSEAGMWFQVKKDSGHWKLEAPRPDFEN